QVQKADSEWKVLGLDPASGLQFKEWEGGKELILSFVVVNLSDETRPVLKVFDHLYLDATGQYQTMHREVIPEAAFRSEKSVTDKADTIAKNLKGDLPDPAVLQALANDMLEYVPSAPPP